MPGLLVTGSLAGVVYAYVVRFLAFMLVVWAIATRMDPARDTTLVEQTPIDYLDFASPTSGLGGKMGLDATNKWPEETDRKWGTPIAMSAVRTMAYAALGVHSRAEALSRLLKHRGESESPSG